MPSHQGRVSVLIADDHPVYREGLARIIKGLPGLELIAEAESGRRALDAIREHAPTVAVVDLQMPDVDGIAIVTAVEREQLATRVVILTGYGDIESVYGAMAAGASAFLSKTAGPETVHETITTVARGGTYLAPEFHGALADQIKRHAEPSGPALSKREREVLRLTADGQAIAQVGTTLHLSPATVKTHLQHTYRKLGVSDRAAAVAEGMRHGLLE